jgi:hypothetical protein
LIFEAVPESVLALGEVGIRAVLKQLHELANLPYTGRPATTPACAVPAVSAVSTSPPGVAAAVREADLLAYTTRATEMAPHADQGAQILRLLTDEARLSLLVNGQAAQLERLLTTHGRTRTRELLHRFLAETRASIWPQEQNSAFTAWLDSNPDVFDR